MHYESYEPKQEYQFQVKDLKYFFNQVNESNLKYLLIENQGSDIEFLEIIKEYLCRNPKIKFILINFDEIWLEKFLNCLYQNSNLQSIILIDDLYGFQVDLNESSWTKIQYLF